MQWFTFDHLPDHLKVISKPFCELAAHVVETLPRTPERTVALRKLLEGKDAAVRVAAARTGCSNLALDAEHWPEANCPNGDSYNVYP